MYFSAQIMTKIVSFGGILSNLDNRPVERSSIYRTKTNGINVALFTTRLDFNSALFYLCSEQTRGNSGTQSNGANADKAMPAEPPKDLSLAAIFMCAEA